MITIKELASICGVSISTVSRAMNGREDVNPETRKAVQNAAKKYGYVPNTAARNLKRPPSRTIAVIVQGETSPLLMQGLVKLDESLRTEGYEAILCHVSDRRANVATIENLIVGGHYSGAIFLGRYGDDDGVQATELSKSLARMKVPLVFCTTKDFSGSSLRHPSVSVDDVGGSIRVTKHLIEQGHTRIGFALINPHVPPESEHVWMLRFQGFKRALREHGIEPDPDLEIVAVDHSQPYSMANAYASTMHWLESRSHDYTAIVSSCDAVAVGVIRALNDEGIRVPEMVSVTGFDGLDFGRYANPSLTTLIQPIDLIAKYTVSSLLKAIAGDSPTPPHHAVEGEFYLGESTAPLSRDGD